MKTGAFSNPFRNPFGNPFGNMVSMPWMLVSLLPPKNVTATVDGSDIDITWTAASSVDGYNIYQSIDGGTWTKLNGTTETGLTYTLTPTDPGEYNFYVTSVRGTKESAASAETTTTEAMMVQVYTDTLSPRISAVDGTAFVDDTADITTYADGNHLLEVQDSDGNVISGVLKAQGSGETLGSELVTNGDFASSDGWTALGWSISTINGTISITDPVNPDRYFYRGASGISLKQLVKTITTVDSGTLTAFISASGALSSHTFTKTSIHYGTVMREVDSPVYYGVSVSTGSITISNVSWKQVTAPSTSGATLVDEISGTTQNLFTAPAGFKYNQSSYTCTIKQILPTA